MVAGRRLLRLSVTTHRVPLTRLTLFAVTAALAVAGCGGDDDKASDGGGGAPSTAHHAHRVRAGDR